MESGARILKGSDAPAILCVILLCIMWATPNLDAQTAYEEQFLLNMPEPSVTNVNIGTGGTPFSSLFERSPAIPTKAHSSSIDCC